MKETAMIFNSDAELKSYSHDNRTKSEQIIKKLLFGSRLERQSAAAYLSLDPFPSFEVILALTSALLDDDPVVREFVITGLSELGPKAVTAIPYIRKRLRACNHIEAKHLLRTLVAIGKPSIDAQQEVKVLMKSHDPQVRVWCIKLIAVWETVNPEIIDLVHLATCDRADEVRTIAEQTYEKLCDAYNNS